MIELPWRRRFIADPNYFRLAYQLAAMQLNAAMQLRMGHGARSTMTIDGRRTSRAELLANSVSSARLVAAEARVLLERYDKRSNHRQWWRGWRKARLEPAERRLERFLSRTVVPSASVVQALALRQQGYLEEADHIVSQVRLAKADDLSYRAYYNLACYEASPGRGETVNAGEEAFAVALEDLRQALRRVFGARLVELIRWAKKDPVLPATGEGQEVRRAVSGHVGSLRAPTHERHGRAGEATYPEAESWTRRAKTR